MNPTCHLMRLVVVLLVMLTAFQISGAESKNINLDAELHKLDKIIKRSNTIEKAKQQQLDSMTRRMAKETGPRQCESALEISRAYRIFNADSSLFYADRAVDLANSLPDSQLRIRAALVRVMSLSTLGIFSTAKSEFNAIDRAAVNPQYLEDYFFTGRTLYGYIITYLNDTSIFTNEARAQYRAYDDSLIALLPNGSNLRDFLISERFNSDGNYREARVVQERLVSKLKPRDPLYAMVTFQMAMTYQREQDTEMTGYYLILASQADMETSVRDGLALPVLANWLYRHGDLDKAYKYINVALEDATQGGVRWRAFAMASMVPSIDEAYRQQMSTANFRLTLYLSIACFFLILTCVSLFFLYRQRREAHEIANKLKTSSRLQDSYIGNFVAMCSSYADRLNSLTSLVDRKLSAGQADELKKMVKSGRFLEGQDDDIYRIFDSAFLDLYPTFVEELNKLLRDDAKIEWHKGQPLTPELRIYAFVRLGVSESTRLAQILHYSVSTVYAYRNRMRNRAIIRDKFEEDVLTI
ncbi:MAG: hypothetical protein HDS26_07090 [Bacteroides sp.]|nr:hypothetical protein [Bacteroides sp.]MBD5307573.1 hypothetical protein [Bacteroides sp.]